MRILIGALAALCAGGCATLPPGAPPATVSPSPFESWAPPPGAAPPASPAKPAQIPDDLRAHAASLSLTDVVDVALRNSPQTREAWWRARAAAADIDVRRAALAPEIDLQAEALSTRQALTDGSGGVTYRTLGPAATLNYLLFDFGGRQADVESARQALFAADFLHNQAIQDVVLNVERTYYQYQGTKALLIAEQTSLKEARTNFEAADERRRSGVATITDVLQTRTALAQAELNVESLDGQLQAVRGGLAATMGLPANLPYDVAPLPAEIAPRQTGEAVEGLIERALAGRPDVESARAQALAAASDLARDRADLLPRLSLQGSLGQPYYGSAFSSPGTVYSGRSCSASRCSTAAAAPRGCASRRPISRPPARTSRGSSSRPRCRCGPTTPRCGRRRSGSRPAARSSPAPSSPNRRPRSATAPASAASSTCSPPRARLSRPAPRRCRRARTGSSRWRSWRTTPEP